MDLLEELHGNDRFVARLRRPDPSRLGVPAHPALVAEGDVVDVYKHLVATLAVPDLTPGVAGVGEDGAYRWLRPSEATPVGVPLLIVSRWARDAVSGQALGDGVEAATSSVIAEDPLCDWCGFGVDLELAQALADRRLARVWVGTGVGEAVTVGRATAEEASLLLGLGCHCGAYSDLDPVALALGHPAVEGHDKVVGVAARVNPSTHLWYPQLDPKVLEHGKSEPELVAIERSRRLPDNNAAKAAVGVAKSLEQSVRLRAPLPRQ